MPFIPHTESDVRYMLERVGASRLEDLFDEIPPHLRAHQLSLEEGRSEMEVMRQMAERAQADDGALCFIGAGAYEHHVPAAVWDLVSRGEFLTAYTPYQAEASQGTLQVIYEFQSMMANLCAMDVCNASVYDGASGLAEAVLMAVRANRRSKSRRVLVPKTVHPLYRAAVRAIVSNQNIEVVEVDYSSVGGHVELCHLEACQGEDFAALVIPQPNFFGVLEDVDALTDWAHANGALVIGQVNPLAMAVLSPPGQWGEKGADIAVGEAQPLGIPLSSGGPYVGFITCREEWVRQMPGRIIGRTVDLEGKPGFALTLQAREQHIRRAKATSNICTNQGLAMAAATIHLSLQGPEGLERVARACHHNIRLLAQETSRIGEIERVFNRPVFHEKVLRLPVPVAPVLSRMAASGVLGGWDLSSHYPELGHALLVCTTETKTEADIARYAQAMDQALRGVAA